MPNGGVFAFSKYRGAEKSRARSKLMKKLERGLGNNYGVLIDASIQALLKKTERPPFRNGSSGS